MITFCPSTVRASVRLLIFLNNLSSEAAEPVLLKFHREPLQVGETKDS